MNRPSNFDTFADVAHLCVCTSSSAAVLFIGRSQFFKHMLNSENASLAVTTSIRAHATMALEMPLAIRASVPTCSSSSRANVIQSFRLESKEIIETRPLLVLEPGSKLGASSSKSDVSSFATLERICATHTAAR